MSKLHRQRKILPIGRLFLLAAISLLSLFVARADEAAAGASHANTTHPLEAAVGVLRSLLSPSSSNPSPPRIADAAPSENNASFAPSNPCAAAEELEPITASNVVNALPCNIPDAVGESAAEQGSCNDSGSQALTCDPPADTAQDESGACTGNVGGGGSPSAGGQIYANPAGHAESATVGTASPDPSCMSPSAAAHACNLLHANPSQQVDSSAPGQTSNADVDPSLPRVSDQSHDAGSVNPGHTGKDASKQLTSSNTRQTSATGSAEAPATTDFSTTDAVAATGGSTGPHTNGEATKPNGSPDSANLEQEASPNATKPSGTLPYPNWRLLRDLEIPDAQVTFLAEDPTEAEALMAPAPDSERESKPQKKPPTWIPTPEEYSRALEERVKAQAKESDPADKGDEAGENAPAGSDGDVRPKRARRRKINLAAASDGATVLSNSKPLKKVEKAIDNDVDSFMKSDCKDNRWLIIELSQLGRVEQLELTMKELYSCRIKDFVLKGRRVDPRKDGGDYRDLFDGEGWQLLGNFTGENKKGTQTFKVKKEAHQLVKFVLIQVLNHWGNDPVCAVNTIRIYGVSAAQDLEDTLSTLTVPPPSAPPLLAQVTEPLPPEAEPQEPNSSTQPAADSSLENTTTPTPPEFPGCTPSAGGSGDTQVLVGSGQSGETAGAAQGGEVPRVDGGQEGVNAGSKEGESSSPEPTPLAKAAEPAPADNSADLDVHITPVVPVKLPSEGGSLYDAIKLEILSLKLNQTLLWGYVRELQAALVQRTMELADDINASEGGLARLKGRVEEVPKMMQASLNQQVSQLLELELKSLRGTMHQCNSALAAARQREVGMALWASAAGGLAALAAVNGGRRGQLRQAVLLLAVVNGLLGTVLVNLAPLQQLLGSFRSAVDMQQLVGLVGGSRS